MFAIKESSESLVFLEVSAELSSELTMTLAERSLEQSRVLELLTTDRYTANSIE